MRERRGEFGFWWRNLNEGENSEYLGVSGRIILKRTLKKAFGRA
jgi:hypothetical protein